MGRSRASRAGWWRDHRLAIVGYAVLTTVALWPAVRHFGSRPLADGADSSVFMWAWWSMPRALGEGSSPFATDLIFHPAGADLALTTTAPLVSAITWPIRTTLSPAAQVNVVQLASMFLAGLATYLLAFRVCRHRGAAFVAGAAYALLPNRFVHVRSHLNLVETAVLPLGILVLLWLLDRPSWRRAAALGAACGLTFLVDPQLAVFVGLALFVIGAVRSDAVAPAARHLVGAAALALVVASPLLVPMGSALASGEGAGSVEADAALYSSAPLAWVVPPFPQLWSGDLIGWDPEPTPTTEGVAYPGLAMLLLAVAGTGTDRARRKGWVALAVTGVVLSFGPLLIVGSRTVDLPMPFDLLQLVPGLDALRVPGRFVLVGALGLHVLAAVTLSGWATRRPQRGGWVVAAACAVTLIELFPGSLPDVSHDVPAAYDAIAADPGDGAVLELPLKWSTGTRLVGFEGHDQNFLFMVYATVHERPVVSGSVSRYPDERIDELLEEPVYRQVIALGGEPGFQDDATFEEDDLRRLGIGYVVYHRDDPVPRALDYVESLELPVLVDDGTVIVWKV